MSGRKKRETEFRYYEIPHGERLLATFTKFDAQSDVEIHDLEYEKRHFHNLMEIGYCVSGSGEMILSEAGVPYGPGMLTVIPPNYLHATRSRSHEGSYWEYLFFNPDALLVEFYPDNPAFARKILEKILKKEQCCQAGEQTELVELVRMILDEYKGKKNYSGEYVRGLLLAMLMLIARGSAEEPVKHVHSAGGGGSQISAAIAYINSNYMENIRLEELASSCNLSETHFRRLFAEFMDTTPVEYINRIRVQQACEMMKKTHYSMEEVARRVGYASISTFNRNFRKMFGTSPYRYKKSSDNYQGETLDSGKKTK